MAWLCALLPAGVLLLSRVPVMFYPRELNADEGQMLAQAMRYLADPIPWRAADGTTSGPLNSWFPLLIRTVGGTLGYAQAHVLAALSWALTLGLLQVAAARCFGWRPAALATLLAALWLAVNQAGDYVHYSSETLSVLLVSAALAGSAGGFRARCLAALLLGLVPWAKIQAAPIAATLGVWLVATTFLANREDETSTGSPAKRAALLVICGALPSLGMAALVWRGGALAEMWQSYFAGNLSYAGAFGAGSVLERGKTFFLSWPMGPWLSAVLLLGGWIAVRRAAFSRPWHGPTALAALLAGVSFVACLRPEKIWPHHQLVLLPALVLLTAAVVGSLAAEHSFARVRLLAGAAAALFIASQLPANLAAVERRAEVAREPTAASIVLRAARAECPHFHSIFVWGWFPPIYVESGLTPPTRDVITHFLTAGLPGEPLLRANFMADLVKAAPDVLIDSGDRQLEHMFGKSSLHDFPELARYVHDEYDLVDTVATASGPVRIFVRKTLRSEHG